MRRLAETALLLCLTLPGCRRSNNADPLAVTNASPIRVRFTDCTAAANIHFTHSHGGTGKKYFVETSGAGAAFFDYDNDGKPDLYLVQSGPLPNSSGFGGAGNRSALYHNLGGGVFEDVTDRAGVGNFRYGQGCCVGDFDIDGNLDLYVTNFGANRLYHNQGNGTFSDVAPRAGVTCPNYNTGAAFADIDGDGLPDLYVARYARYRLGSDPACSLAPGLHSYCPPVQFPGEVDALFRNNGNGTFTDITKPAGVVDTLGRGLGVIFFDYNDDGKPDLYVANDGGIDRLYENLGHDRFRDVTATAGVGMGEDGRLTANMGVDAGDYLGDGRLDLLVTTFTAEPTSLYRNQGDGTFDLVGTSSGLGAPGLPYTKFGVAFYDFDLDGWPDVVVANGHVADDVARASPGITYAEPNSLYRNRGNGTFQDVSRSVGPDFVVPRVGRGLALADIDGDGDQDIVINDSNSRPVLLRNDGGNQHHWLQVRLRAAHGDPFALGAKLELDAGGHKQVREVRSGGSYLSQNDLTQVFGLGTLKSAAQLTVRWPDGTRQVWRDLPADSVQTLRQAGLKTP